VRLLDTWIIDWLKVRTAWVWSTWAKVTNLGSSDGCTLRAPYRKDLMRVPGRKYPKDTTTARSNDSEPNLGVLVQMWMLAIFGITMDWVDTDFPTFQCLWRCLEVKQIIWSRKAFKGNYNRWSALAGRLLIGDWWHPCEGKQFTFWLFSSEIVRRSHDGEFGYPTFTARPCKSITANDREFVWSKE
jgi:hypothetical protein